MSASKLAERSECHLYAGETFKDIAEKLPELMSSQTEAERLAVYAVRSILLQVAQSELTVAQTLCDMAVEQEALAC